MMDADPGAPSCNPNNLLNDAIMEDDASEVTVQTDTSPKTIDPYLVKYVIKLNFPQQTTNDAD